MGLTDEYRAARHQEKVARLRRLIALRAMLASGMSQRQAAAELGISQPAVCQQLKATAELEQADAATVFEAGAPIIKQLTQERGYSRAWVFGSVARGDAGPQSDIDLMVEPPPGISMFDLARLKLLIDEVLGQDIDLISYTGLKGRIDDDIRRDAVLL